MKFKASKSRTISIIEGKLKDQRSHIDGTPLPVMSEMSVRSLAQWYDASHEDSDQSKPLQEETIQGLANIDKILLPGERGRCHGAEGASCSVGSCGNKDRRRSPLRRKGSSRSPRRRMRPDETELIQVEVEQLPASPRTPERISLDSVSLSSPLDKWDEVNLDVEDGGCRRRCEKRCTSHHSSSELL
eukprot:superscaffoldBa00005831_g20837